MSRIRNWWYYFGWVSLFLTILTLVIAVTINAYPLYIFEVSRLNLAENLGLTKAQLLLNYREMMAYLNLPWHHIFTLPDFVHSASGAFHFYEVKKLFMLNYAVLGLTCIPSGLFIRQLKKTGSLWRLVRPFQFAAMLPFILGFVMLTAFDWFFVTFHSLFFNNDDWLFNPVTDPIINALPESYFMKCFILGFVLLEMILLIGIYLGKHQLANKKTLN